MSAFASFASTVVGTALLLGVTHVAAKEASPKELTVKRLVLAHGVDNREPQDPSSTFKTQDDRVYAFVELQNPTKTAGRISVVFVPPSGSALAEIPLEVGDTSRFRTWAFTRKAHDAGQWGVVVRDDKGRLLARETFTVER
jgi:hypothetical protein